MMYFRAGDRGEKKFDKAWRDIRVKTHCLKSRKKQFQSKQISQMENPRCKYTTSWIVFYVC